jgi:hypothetical protein
VSIKTMIKAGGSEEFEIELTQAENDMFGYVVQWTARLNGYEAMGFAVNPSVAYEDARKACHILVNALSFGWNLAPKPSEQ